MAITANNVVDMKTKHLDHEGMKVDYEVAASTVIYRDSFVGLNATGYLTSYVAPAVYTGATATGTKFVGIALEAITSQTSDGDKRCSVLVDGYFEYTLTGAVRIDIGTPVFASDNSTMVMAGSSGNCIGYIVGGAGTNTALVKLIGPSMQFAGHFLTVVSPAIDYATLGQKILLVHETQNPGGLLLCNCSGYSTEVHRCASAAGVITIQHTADTTMGCLLTAVDNAALYDVIVGTPGVMWGAAASDEPMLVAPAGTQVNAEVTTQSNESATEAGQIKICASFLCL